MWYTYSTSLFMVIIESQLRANYSQRFMFRDNRVYRLNIRLNIVFFFEISISQTDQSGHTINSFQCESAIYHFFIYLYASSGEGERSERDKERK